jgi:DNA-binding beta-propeller fold protein YncE
MATVVGSGDYRYEVAPSWPKMPKYWSFGGPSDAAVNSNDEVHVFSRGAHPVTIWDTEGNFITSWGEGDISEGGAHGIFITPDDHVWLAHMYDHVVTEHKPNGEQLLELGMRHRPSPHADGRPFNMPTGVARAPTGEIFVSDGYGGSRVHKFSRNGDLLLSWGGQGKGPGEFALLHNVGVDSRGRVLICDRENDRIQFFDGDGNYLEQWTDFTGPGDVWIRDDIIYVNEQFGGAGVSIWTLEGDLISRWRAGGGPGGDSLLPGHGITVDSEGSIYVMALGGDSVQKLVRV